MYYSTVDDLTAGIRDAEARGQQPLKTPAIRQREAQIASLEETVELLSMTDSDMKDMVAKELEAREEVS